MGLAFEILATLPFDELHLISRSWCQGSDKSLQSGSQWLVLEVVSKNFVGIQDSGIKLSYQVHRLRKSKLATPVPPYLFHNNCWPYLFIFFIHVVLQGPEMIAFDHNLSVVCLEICWYNLLDTFCQLIQSFLLFCRLDRKSVIMAVWFL